MLMLSSDCLIWIFWIFAEYDKVRIASSAVQCQSEPRPLVFLAISRSRKGCTRTESMISDYLAYSRVISHHTPLGICVHVCQPASCHDFQLMQGKIDLRLAESR